MPQNDETLYIAQNYQRDMTADILGGHKKMDARLDTLIVSDNVAAQKRMEIYRNNVIGGLVEVLLARFPALTPLCGEEFTRTLARQYIQVHPPQTGNLNEYAADYPAFLKQQPVMADFPFLYDVAMLENYEHQAYYAPFVPFLDFDNIAQYAPLIENGVHQLRLTPSTYLICSEYPILALRAFALNGGDGAMPDMSRANTHFYCVARKDMAIICHELSAAEYVFLCAVRDKKNLAAALGAALERDDAFDFTTALPRFVAWQLFAQ